MATAFRATLAGAGLSAIGVLSRERFDALVPSVWRAELLLPGAARRKPLPHVTSAMAVILAANLIYLVPNSALSPISWLMGGAVAGFIAWREVEQRAEAPPEDDAAETPRSPYTRFAHGGVRSGAVPLRRTHQKGTAG